MMKFLESLILALVAIVLLGLVATLSGTFIWLLWPVAIPAVFPGLVASGVIAGKLSWWASVCLAWLAGILIKSSQTTVTKS